MYTLSINLYSQLRTGANAIRISTNEENQERNLLTLFPTLICISYILDITSLVVKEFNTKYLVFYHYTIKCHRSLKDH